MKRSIISPLRHFGVAFSLLVCSLIPAAAALAAEDAQTPSGKEVYAKYVQALGGKEALAKLNSRKTVANVEMKPMGLKGKAVTYEARPKKSVSKIEFEGLGAMEEGVDGTHVWENNVMTGPKIKTGKEKALGLAMATFDDAEFEKEFKEMECVGAETINDEACWKVIMTPIAEINPIEAFFSKKSGLLVKTTMKVETEMGVLPVEAFAFDYKEYDGVMLPTRLLQKVAGMMELEMVYTSVEHNAQLPEGCFDPPAVVRALIDKAATEQK